MSQATKQIAIFEVETSFNITGRGIVAVGKFIEGMAKLGAKTNVVVNDKLTPVTITGIEWGKLDDEGTIKFGLFLRFDDDECKKTVEQYRLQKQEIVLEHPLT
jgi:translation elongation factor EF-Tu-like GTPase